jgi:two-component system sensor histidine kinase DegS
MSVFDLVPARLKQQTINFLSDIRAGVLVKPFETKRIAKDGSVIDVCLTVTRMVQNGEIVAITTTERDITNHNLLAESLQKLPRRIIMAQEDERSRISQVLHSELGQALITLKLFIVVTASRQASENDAMRTVFDKIRAQLDKIINDTRNLAHKLSPPGLKYTGLIPAIRELVESATSEKLQIQFLHNGGNNACFKKKDIIIYRILQEALQNIIKHSEATRARVSVVLKKTAFSLEVCDNGKGFNTSFQSSAKGLGLALMKQQAALIYGKLSIESQEGKGTLLKVRIPLKERNAK